jgi:hypothetical protein
MFIGRKVNDFLLFQEEVISENGASFIGFLQLSRSGESKRKQGNGGFLVD